MKIVQLTYMERINLGNYQHAELTAMGVIQEGEDVNTAMLTLKTFVQASLKGEVAKMEEKVEAPIVHDTTPIEVAVVEEPKKEKKTRAKKEKIEVEVAPVETPEESAKKSPAKTIAYDSNVQEHKGIFGTFLNNTYGEAWKTVKPKEEIQAFTKSLNGKAFLDDNGNMLKSFLAEVTGFFGA